MARPKKKRNDIRPHRITIRVSDLENELIQNRANELGISASSYIRREILDSKIEMRYEIVADIPELQRLTSEFGKLGTNLNQIAKYFNMGGVRSKSMQDEIHECISQIFAMREEVRKMAGDYHGSFKAHRN